MIVAANGNLLAPCYHTRSCTTLILNYGSRLTLIPLRLHGSVDTHLRAKPRTSFVLAAPTMTRMSIQFYARAMLHDFVDGLSDGPTEHLIAYRTYDD